MTDFEGTIAVIALGVSAIGLGCKGFTAAGLPWKRGAYITGTAAEVVGGVCMLIGAAILCFALYALSKGL